MSDAQMTVAMISEVFFEDDAAARLETRLKEARDLGADVAVLPEIPLNPWSPATKQARDDDAEAPGGRRHEIQANAARAAGIALVGGAIVTNPDTGRRHNTALSFDASGELVSTFEKLHVPDEPGFWECDHYDPGSAVARPVGGLPLSYGVQICSDINRPEGSHLLGAMGAHVVFNPRSTELCTYYRWRLVFQANAITSAAFVVSVNRPNAEQGILIGGPSIAVAPNGTVLCETTEKIGIATLDGSLVTKAHKDYPGYLPVRADLYAKAWQDVAG